MRKKENTRSPGPSKRGGQLYRHRYQGSQAAAWRKTSQQEGLKNVAFIRTRIELIKVFAPAEVNAVWITFPDPQPEKRTKGTSARFLERYLNFQVPHAQIHLKTDSRSLYDYTREVVRGWPGMILLESDPDIYNGKRMPDDPVITVRTFYEKQFLEQGKAITYLKFSTGNLSRVNPEEA